MKKTQPKRRFKGSQLGYGKVINYNLSTTLYPDVYRKRTHICCMICKTDQPMWALRKECLFCGETILQEGTMWIIEVGPCWTIVEVDGIQYAVFSLLEPKKITATFPNLGEINDHSG